MSPRKTMPCTYGSEVKPDKRELKILISRLHADGVISWAEYEAIWERLEK